MYPVSAKYLEAVRYPHRIETRLEAWRGASRIDEALTDGEGLPFRGGEVTVDTSPGVRRTLATTLAPAPGLADLLAPVGTELRPVSVLHYPDGEAEEVPLGRFPVLGAVVPIANGELRVDASDLYSTLQRARFLRPKASTPGRKIVDTIVDLVRDVLGFDWPADTSGATSAATVGALVWDRDRTKALEDLAAAAAVDVAFDATGVLIVRDVPNVATARPAWTLATGAGGTITGGSRRRSRRKTYNVVVAAGKATDGTALFDPVIVWDDRVGSATYAGPDPLTRPAEAGPFGVVPYFLTSPLLRTASQARAAALTALARVTGLEQQLDLSASPNLALDGYDVVDVVLVGDRVERHVIDRVTHPLGAAGDQAIATRSTRPDAGTDETEQAA